MVKKATNYAKTANIKNAPENKHDSNIENGNLVFLSRWLYLGVGIIREDD